MAVIMLTYTEAWNIELKTSKPLCKKWKNKINIFCIVKKTNLKVERIVHNTGYSHFTQDIPTFDELVIKNTLVKKLDHFPFYGRSYLPQRQIS